MATSAHVIDIHSVNRHFGSIRAVDGVSFTVGAGEIFGLIGHNGAGKSTLFKMMLGLLSPSNGEIRLCGESVSGARFREVRRQIGYLPENLVLYDNLSGTETLRFFSRLKGNVERKQCEELLETVGLTHAAKRRVKEYSKGMRQRLGFAQALLGHPKLLLLDEPTNGLDPQGIHEFYAVLERVRASGATVILTSHILSEIEQRVDRLALMNMGKLAALGSVAELSSAIALPLRIEITATDGAIDQIEQCLKAAGFVTRQENQKLSFAISSEEKIGLLPILADLGNALSDVRFIEPSLEAVFLGHHNSKNKV
ncbi:MAG: ABC transporter ATP-binding protein [Betaproteobacteria bacterium]|nr:ABC transporter ATP-binding protein [Betaproteobacteria bacterium]